MKTRLQPAALLVAAALLVGLGVAVGFVLGRSPAPPPAPSAAPRTESSLEPMIVIDPSKVHLLPDASLHLDLPAPPDASLPDEARTRSR